MPWKETQMINERTEFALKSIQPGINFSDLCTEYGISRRVGYKWKKRFLEEGAAGMSDLSRRPLSSPAGLNEAVICRIARLHQAHQFWGPKKIREVYARSYGEAPSESSFKRIFDKSGWVKKRRRRAHADGGRLWSDRKAQSCNEIWTVDFKGWWHTADGKRCEPLTVRDEYSRYLLEVRSMASACTQAVREVFERLFKRHGLPAAIRSDNGPPFASSASVLGLSRLSAWWIVLGIDLERGRPGKPQDNGAHERMHRDIRRELQCHACADPASQQAAFDVWRTTFNQERPHEALGMSTPAQLYHNSNRVYTGTPCDLSYNGMIARKVMQCGRIRIEGIPIQISSSLSGWSVGLIPSQADRYDVFFAKLRIGELDLSSQLFLRASGPEEEPRSQKNAS